MRLPVHKKLNLSNRKSALLLVDLQEEQRSDLDYHAHDYDQVLANASLLLGVARLNAFHVAHAAYMRDFDVEPPRPFEATRPDGSPTFSDAAGDLTAICAEVAPTKEEQVFVKNDASAFRGTDLDRWLKDIEADWLIICGVWTEACISSTVRDAIANGYRVLLVKDACGSGSKAMHETAVLNLSNRLYGGGICDTARAVALLTGGAAQVWQMVDPVPIRFEHDTITEFYDQL